MKSDRFLSACRMQPVDQTPIWLMRQAGRSLPKYRDLKSRFGFLELARRPELMTEITLMPIDYFDVDALIIFADIMLPLAALGIEFEITEGVGPVVADPVRTSAQIDRMTSVPVGEAVPAVAEALRLTTKDLDGKLPVIGFSGAPFTLACYLIEGRPSREFTRARTFMHADPAGWHKLMDRLTHLVIDYLGEQAEAGASALQLFDSWVGVVGPADYSEFVLPYSSRVFSSLTRRGLPLIHFGTGTNALIEQMAEPPIDVLGVDWRTPIDDAWKRIGFSKAIQGNLDPAVLSTTPKEIERSAGDILDRVGGRPGHIFNLGHGVLPETPVENIKLLVDLVHEQTSATTPKDSGNAGSKA